MKSINIIRNPSFDKGANCPSGWVWSSTGSRAHWERAGTDSTFADGGVRIVSQSAGESAWWTQEVPCKPGTYYRIEASVSCNISNSDGVSGLILSVHANGAGDHALHDRKSCSNHRTDDPMDVRAYYEVPKNVRHVMVRVGLHGAAGSAVIHHVRMIQILEPDAEAHVLAVPPPVISLPIVHAARSVLICTHADHHRPIVDLLGVHLGAANVSTVSHESFQSDAIRADAVLFPDDSLPHGLRSLAKLVELSDHRIVVVSLRALAGVTRGAAAVRRIEQDDDPIHAKVVFGHRSTQGFALDDVFPFAWRGKDQGTFVQQHLKRSTALTTFLKRHHFHTLLVSVCDKDSTSDHPVALHKYARHGGLFAIDIEPMETIPSTMREPLPAVHLLLAMLGHNVSGLGQYVVPARAETSLRGTIREFARRFPPAECIDSHVPDEDVHDQAVIVGRTTETFGLPLKPKPVILLRSGLAAGDVESIYGTLLWIKQLLRGEPFTCPYVDTLGARFRLAWLPYLSDWESADGWHRSSRPANRNTPLPCELPEIQTWIDVVSVQAPLIRVVIPSRDVRYDRYLAWLPRLFQSFPAIIGLTLEPDGQSFVDRSSGPWIPPSRLLKVDVDPSLFASDGHQAAAEAGAELVRIETPGNLADFPASSIQRTSLVATLLEHVVGLQMGLVAVNRTGAPVLFDGFPPIEPGKVLWVDRNDSVLAEHAAKVG